LPPGCRGIFYRIFLSRTIGAEDLGIFNMVHPVYGICFALRAGSIQTAISRFVAADVQKGKQIFRTGLVISLTLSIALAAFVRQQVSFLLILSYISLS
jgi:stage V sporulation protein B